MVTRRTIRRHATAREVITIAPADFASPDVPDRIDGTGTPAWLQAIEAAAAEVLRRAGFVLRSDRLGLEIAEGAVDPHGLSAPARAARLLGVVRCARVALAGRDMEMAFEWGAKVAEAWIGLDLELAGWPRAVQAGAGTHNGGRKGGRQTASANAAERHRKIEAIRAVLARLPGAKPKKILGEPEVGRLFHSGYDAFRTFLYENQSEVGYRPGTRKL